MGNGGNEGNGRECRLPSPETPPTGLADATRVSGVATGAPTALGDVKHVRAALPNRPILVGSGVVPETVAEILQIADGAIVGTWVKREGQTTAPVDPARVAAVARAARTE